MSCKAEQTLSRPYRTPALTVHQVSFIANQGGTAGTVLVLIFKDRGLFLLQKKFFRSEIYERTTGIVRT